jgi:hypothetical protein
MGSQHIADGQVDGDPDAAQNCGDKCPEAGDGAAYSVGTCGQVMVRPLDHFQR